MKFGVTENDEHTREHFEGLVVIKAVCLGHRLSFQDHARAVASSGTRNGRIAAAGIDIIASCST
jgi:hypothetical protein